LMYANPVPFGVDVECASRNDYLGKTLNFE
jgi:hypothetical protein